MKLYFIIVSDTYVIDNYDSDRRRDVAYQRLEFVRGPGPFSTNTYDIPASKLTWCLTSTGAMRLIRDGEKGGRGYGGGGKGNYTDTYRYTVTTRMTSALRWATVTAI